MQQKTNRWLVAAVMGMTAAWLMTASMYDANRPTVPALPMAFVAQAKAQDKAPPKAEEKNPPKGMEELKKDAKAFKRGAIPTPKHKLIAAPRFRPSGLRALPQVAYVPKQLDMWGNNQYGDCVSAEEAFNQAACGTFIASSVVTGWAGKNGFLNGADLLEVMQAMNKSGMVSNGKTYGVGASPVTVDYSNESVLQSALDIAPVKIGIDANALPSGAGNNQGWYKFGGRPNQYNNEDHCVSLAGHGPASAMFGALNTAVPSGTDATKTYYLLFTWSTIGVVDHDWIMSTVGEAWLRNPSQLVDGQPSPNPGPSTSPPAISSPLAAAVAAGAAFSYQIAASNAPTSYGATGLPATLAVAATTGQITGSVAAGGVYNVTISATNAAGTGTAVLVLTVTGAPTPPPGPGPAPSTVIINLSADQILGATRDPSGKVTLTTAQVQFVLDSSGLTTVSGDESFRSIVKKLQKCAEAPPSPFKSSPTPVPASETRIDRLEKAFLEFMKRENAK